jgi:hypothetical protein
MFTAVYNEMRKRNFKMKCSDFSNGDDIDKNFNRHIVPMLQNDDLNGFESLVSEYYGAFAYDAMDHTGVPKIMQNVHKVMQRNSIGKADNILRALVNGYSQLQLNNSDSRISREKLLQYFYDKNQDILRLVVRKTWLQEIKQSGDFFVYGEEAINEFIEKDISGLNYNSSYLDLKRKAGVVLIYRQEMEKIKTDWEEYCKHLSDIAANESIYNGETTANVRASIERKARIKEALSSTLQDMADIDPDRLPVLAVPSRIRNKQK